MATPILGVKKVFKFKCLDVVGWFVEGEHGMPAIPLTMVDPQNPMAQAVIGAVGKVVVKEMWIDARTKIKEFQAVGTAYWYADVPEWWDKRVK